LGAAAEVRVARPLRECDHVELYSCFPLAVRVQQRELGFAPDGTPTITGGMTFAGGPFNSFVLQATAAMARRLRAAPGVGLITSVSGMLTKPGLAVWASEPDDRPPLVADLAAEATAATAAVEVASTHEGPAAIAACTVTYDGMDPKELVAILDTDSGTRVIAKSSDPEWMRRATSEELVGTRVDVSGNALR
jgi:acetyl-CoA C-acetyltransferase